VDPIKISAKNLGQTALEDFCPRCYWIKLKTNFKLPWQSFPGIFSSIDAYTKHCIHQIIDTHANTSTPLPEWMQSMGDIIRYEKVPHWSKNTFHDEKSNITLHGAQDDILVCTDGKRVGTDYKTAKHSETQDKLLPLYEVQENVYSVLSEKDNKEPVKLFLVYMEPCTDASYSVNNIDHCGFRMCFSGVVVPVIRDRKIVRKALNLTREIYEMKSAPFARNGCKDCEQLDVIRGLLVTSPAEEKKFVCEKCKNPTDKLYGLFVPHLCQECEQAEADSDKRSGNVCGICRQPRSRCCC